jgi:hypothetical protein
MNFANSSLFLSFTDFEKSRGQKRVSHLKCHGERLCFLMPISKKKEREGGRPVISVIELPWWKRVERKNTLK